MVRREMPIDFKISNTIYWNVSITPHIPSPNLLTHVEIRNSNMSFDILTFFSCVPMLENASFFEGAEDAIPKTSLDSSPDILKTPIIPLRSLQKLSFQWYPTVFIDTILRMIQYPTSAEITIVTRTSRDDIDLDSVPECLHTVLSSCSTLSLSLRLTGSPIAFILEFKAPNSSFHHIEIVPRDDLAPYFTARGFRGTSGMGEDTFVPGSGGNSLRQIRKLTLSSKYLPSSEILTRLLRRLLSLEELSVQTRNVTPLLTALGSTSLLCPALSHLDLRRSRIDPGELQDMLQAREDVDSRIHRLTITMDPRIASAIGDPSNELFATASGSKDTPIDLSALEALVDHLDGDEGYWSDGTVPDRRNDIAPDQRSDFDGYYSDYSYGPYGYAEGTSEPDSDYWRRQNSD
ncbi:hypothetical protein SISSUDRAFT_1066930 [Sistotremastrum suecicum HHB10207 ss-3]|uniref:Uncharacterized protein n=1 Tax=Sistotremastrum suecicum HHB10207 ss-3 TaxID=1314776 RepID=A0A165XQF2_9AGAM|nr:hypothetical protein SISSUDRAFT_1066930 [Sistotremastrum suecicum HHB10207 ss-3]